MEKKIKRDAFRASLVQKTAQITGLKENYIRKVLRSDRENETVMSVYMALLEGSNELVKQVKELVPFD